MGSYRQRINDSLVNLGYAHGLQITQCGGGTVPVARASGAPLLTLDSGPVSGVTASMFLGAAMGEKNVITTDMGGTSFDVSIIHDGKPASRSSATPTSTSTSCRKSTCRRSARAAAAWCASSQRR